MKIEIIAGSPRQQSVTVRLAHFLQAHLSQHTPHEVGLIDVREWDLPLLQSIFKTVDDTPEAYKPLAQRMFDADAFILVSPEYNGSYASAMKNLLDYFPKQSHKTFGIVTASPGGTGGIRASQQMQLLVGAFFGVLCPYMLIVPGVDKKFNAEGELIDEGFAKIVNQFVSEYLWLAEAVHQKELAAQEV